jgi:hypothetical protein
VTKIQCLHTGHLRLYQRRAKRPKTSIRLGQRRFG